MSKEVAEFMIFVVEQIANRFFAGDQFTTYAVMKESGLWQFFSDTYETSHTVDVAYLMEDAENWFARYGIDYASLSR